MNILFAHRNFPAQFRHLIFELLKEPKNKIAFITNRKELSIPNVTKITYDLHREVRPDTHHYLKFYEDSVLHGQGSLRAALALKTKGFKPDIMFAHSWGTALFLKEAYPDVPLLCYFEWFYNTYGSDLDFDKSRPINVDMEARTRIKNSHILVDLYSCDHGISPTQWQKSQFPKEYNDKISVIHDGVDTNFFKPDSESKFVIPGIDLSGVEEIITYATRGMEPYRGFPQFMEAVAILLKKRPNCHVVVAGEDRVCYGSKLPNGKTFKELMLEKLDLDMSRVHFTGRLPYDDYLKLLQVTNAHVYLTYPFVLSWSMLEAMSTGCPIIASNTAPVNEVAVDNENCLLVDFYNIDQIVARVEEALDNKDKMLSIREKARELIVKNYDQKDCLAKQLELINQIIHKNSILVNK